MRDQDILLTVLASVVDLGEDSGIAVTVGVGGLLISGQMISARAYFKRLSEYIDDGTGALGAKKVLVEGLKSMGSARESSGARADMHSGFIHLCDASAFHSSSHHAPPPKDSPDGLWRVKRAAIDIVHLGPYPTAEQQGRTA